MVIVTALSGFFVGEEDMRRIVQSERLLEKYSQEQLAQGVHCLDFMGAGVYEYVVTKESVFHPYFEREGRREAVFLM